MKKEKISKAIKKIELKHFEEYKSLIFSTFIFILVIGIIGIITFNKESQITLETNHIYVHEGESYTVEYKLEGINENQLSWESEDEEIAAVSFGKIKGIKKGDVKIIVSSPSLKKEILVTVISKEKEKTSITNEKIPIIKYTCADGWELKGKKCYLYTVKDEKCLDGYSELGGLCFIEVDANKKYSCEEGYNYIEGKCVK